MSKNISHLQHIAAKLERENNPIFEKKKINSLYDNRAVRLATLLACDDEMHQSLLKAIFFFVQTLPSKRILSTPWSICRTRDELNGTSSGWLMNTSLDS